MLGKKKSLTMHIYMYVQMSTRSVLLFIVIPLILLSLVLARLSRAFFFDDVRGRAQTHLHEKSVFLYMYMHWLLVGDFGVDRRKGYISCCVINNGACCPQMMSKRVYRPKTRETKREKRAEGENK